MWTPLVLAALALLLALVLFPDASRRFVRSILDRILTYRSIANSSLLKSVRATLSAEQKSEAEKEAQELSMRGRKFISPMDDRVPLIDRCVLRTAERTFEDFIRACEFGIGVEWYYKKTLRVVETAERVVALKGLHAQKTQKEFSEWSSDVRAWANGLYARA